MVTRRTEPVKPESPLLSAARPRDNVAVNVPEIVIVGLGPGSLSLLTREAEETLLAADRVLFRTAHPAYGWLQERGREPYCFNLIYQTPGISADAVYEFIADAVMREATTRGRAVYAVPGHPFVFEHSALMLVERGPTNGIAVKIVPGMSFIDLVCAELRLDPWAGLQLCNALDFVDADPPFTPDTALLIAQLSVRASLAGLGEDRVAESVGGWLDARFPADHPISFVWTTRKPEYATASKTIALADFVPVCAELKAAKLSASAYVPRRNG
jgi:uncharacterized protein YabN with tetrapyrrole methylase and pyrophosphatase domain